MEKRTIIRLSKLLNEQELRNVVAITVNDMTDIYTNIGDAVVNKFEKSTFNQKYVTLKAYSGNTKLKAIQHIKGIYGTNMELRDIKLTLDSEIDTIFELPEEYINNADKFIDEHSSFGLNWEKVRM